MNIIIPASGAGQRFVNAGYKDLKPLIQVTDSKKIIDYVIDSFDRYNDKFFFITSESGYQNFENYISQLNINYEHVITDGPKSGPVGAIMDVFSEFNIDSDEPVIVSYCDYGMEWNYENFLEYVSTSGVDGSIPCYTGYHPHLKYEENIYAATKSFHNYVYAVKEKYHSKNRSTESWSPGAYYFRTFDIMTESFTALMKAKDTIKDEYYVSLAYNYIVEKYKITSYDLVKKFYQFGTPRDFEYAKSKLNIVENLENKSSSIANTIVLAAGKGERFLNLGYIHPKPFIPLKGTDIISNIKESLSTLNTKITYIGSDAHEEYWKNYNVNLIQSNKIGAAYSYKKGAFNISGETLIIPCDLIAQHITEEFLKVKEDADFIIFTTNPSEYAQNNKKSFAWVGGESNRIKDVSIKEVKDGNNMVLIGSFWVRRNEDLLKAINKIFEEEYKVNNEYYLDNAFKYLHENGFNVKFVNLTNYLSFGTPDEYYENKYWFELLKGRA